MEIKEKEIELWKDIQGYEGLYQISSLGNVKSLNYNRTGEERIMKQIKDKNGYNQLSLNKESQKKNYRVHRLVASAFLPNPQNLLEVNHKDENKQNNHVDNLEWCSHTYNVNYGTRLERCSKSMIGKNKGKILSQEHKNKLSKAHKGKISHQKPILQFNKQGTKILGKYNSVKQASNELNISYGNICECCNGKRKSTGGYRWMYLEDYVNRMEKLYNILKKAS